MKDRRGNESDTRTLSFDSFINRIALRRSRSANPMARRRSRYHSWRNSRHSGLCIHEQAHIDGKIKSIPGM